MTEDLKKNHHYVPQFWLRRFSGDHGRLLQWDGKRAEQIGSVEVMTQDWLYTVYNNQWIASNDLENHIAKLEGKADRALKAVERSPDLTQATADPLLDFLALQASRHPDMLQRSLNRRKELAQFLALSHDMTLDEFQEGAKDFGIAPLDAENMHKAVISQKQENILAEYERLEALSLQDSEIPLADFLDAMTPIANALSHMNIRLLDAPQSHYFVLGDTPVPQYDALKGFIVPLNKSLAVQFGTASANPLIYPRASITPDAVTAINRAQWEMAKKIVVGPHQNTFQALSL